MPAFGWFSLTYYKSSTRFAIDFVSPCSSKISPWCLSNSTWCHSSVILETDNRLCHRLETCNVSNTLTSHRSPFLLVLIKTISFHVISADASLPNFTWPPWLLSTFANKFRSRHEWELHPLSRHHSLSVALFTFWHTSIFPSVKKEATLAEVFLLTFEMDTAYVYVFVNDIWNSWSKNLLLFDFLHMTCFLLFVLLLFLLEALWLEFEVVIFVLFFASYS